MILFLIGISGSHKVPFHIQSTLSLVNGRATNMIYSHAYSWCYWAKVLTETVLWERWKSPAKILGKCGNNYLRYQWVGFNCFYTCALWKIVLHEAEMYWILSIGDPLPEHVAFCVYSTLYIYVHWRSVLFSFSTNFRIQSERNDSTVKKSYSACKEEVPTMDYKMHVRNTCFRPLAFSSVKLRKVAPVLSRSSAKCEK